jgi:excisionase family DNA binding protein
MSAAVKEMATDKLMRTREVAAFLDVSRVKVYHLIREGRLRAIDLGGDYRVSREALREFMEQNQTS